jgi:ceramide synthetase
MENPSAKIDAKEPVNRFTKASATHDNMEAAPLVAKNSSNEKQTTEASSKEKKEQFDKYELMWKIISIISVLGSFWATYSLIDFAEWGAKNLPNSAKWSDISYAFLLVFVFQAVRTAFKKLLFRPIYDGLEGKYEGEERVLRANRVVKWSYDTIYYASCVLFQFHFYRKTPLIPPMFFGEGDTSQVFKNMPGLPDTTEFPYLKEYYLVQMASHLCTLFEQIIVKRKEVKFYEYFLHHFLSFFLLLNSYMNHEWLLGATVMLCHDVTDVFLASSRSIETFVKPTANSWKGKLVYVYFANCVFVWIYSRIIFFTSVSVYESWMNFGNWPEVWPMISIVYYYSFFLLLVLFALDAYWGVIMVGIVVKSLLKKNYKNTYDPSLVKLVKKN